MLRGVLPVPESLRSSTEHQSSTQMWHLCLVGQAASHAAYLTGHTFFPSLISGPFQQGLDIAFDFAIAACLVAAVASLLRGRRYVHDDHAMAAPEITAESGDDLEGREAGVGRVGDPAPVGRHLAQRR